MCSYLRLCSTVLLFIVMVAASETASAASCTALRAELASASGRETSGSNRQLAALEKRAVANGCRGSATFGRPRACAGIDAQIRSLSAGEGGNPRRAARLRRQIREQCDTPKRSASAGATEQRANPARSARVAPPASGVIIHGTRADNKLDVRARSGGGFLARLFGAAPDEQFDRDSQSGVERVVIDENQLRQKSTHTSTASLGGGVGNFRTLSGSGLKTWCVRLCDGFYFPISTSASSSDYPHDLAMCQARCPGVDVSLYSHRSGAQVEGMVSAVTGEPYTALPTAFAYRKAFYPSCSCTLEAPQFQTADIEPDQAPDADRADPPAGAGTGTGTDPMLVAASFGSEAAPSQDGADAAGPAAAEPWQRVKTTLTPTISTDGGVALTTAFAPAGAGEALSAAEAVVNATAATPIGTRPPLPDAPSHAAAPLPPTIGPIEPLRVRAVGPQFFAGQEAGEVVQVRDPARVQ